MIETAGNLALFPSIIIACYMALCQQRAPHREGRQSRRSADRHAAQGDIDRLAASG
jgi:hypothetical protein